MQRLATEIIDASIHSVSAGHRIGNVVSILVRDSDLKAEIFVVKSPDSDGLKYLLSSDIRAYDGKRIIINSHQELSDSNELLRHQELIKDNRLLLSTKVFTQSGKRLGRVKDYSIDTAHYFVTKLHVTAKWPQRLIHERFIIDRTSIIDVKKDKVIVSDTTIKAKANAKVLPA